MGLKGNRLIALLAFAVLAMVISGCISSPAEYKRNVISLNATPVGVPSCMCMLCTNSTGNKMFDVFVSNDMSKGACYFRDKCTREFIYYFLQYDDDNYVKDFGVGVGSTFTEFEESNLRCGLGEDYAVRVLYSKYRPPIYDKEMLFGTWDSEEGDTIECMLEKGVLPIYVIYTEGTYVQDGWLDDFMDQLDAEGGSIESQVENVIIVPEAKFTEEMAQNVSRQVNKIYSLCKPEIGYECLEWEGGYDPHYPQTCKRKVNVQRRGCNVAVFPAQGNPPNIYGDTPEEDRIFKALDALNSTRSMDKVSAVITTLEVNREEHKCDAHYALALAANRSRMVLNKYGKPTFLLLSISKDCEANKTKIAQVAYTSIEILRQVGVFGMAYSQYFASDGNPLSVSGSALPLARDTNQLDNKEWMKLCNYYTAPNPYRKEPVVFQSNGVNFTTECDFTSNSQMRIINSSDLDKLEPKTNKIDLSKDTEKKYKLCVPEVDFGSLEDIASCWEEWDKYEVPTEQSDCSVGYPSVELNAERCGLSRHLLRALYSENIRITDCKEWYDTEKELADKKIITIANIKPGSSDLQVAAFMFALKKSEPDVYKKVLNSQPVYGQHISPSEPCGLCNGVEDENGYLHYYSIPCRVIKKYQEYRDECKIEDLFDEITGVSRERPAEAEGGQ
ncbi:MAG: hypothetical protein N3H30_02125 [Candidatus Micrarchaeota archaeon]|nr:hypothetical protein [Candidatus Micrarchaeota archaeon]